jgi:hypothetical protein
MPLYPNTFLLSDRSNRGTSLDGVETGFRWLHPLGLGFQAGHTLGSTLLHLAFAADMFFVPGC